MITALENHLWQSTLFCCAMAMLTLMLRKDHAAVRHALWLAASVKISRSVLAPGKPRKPDRTAPAACRAVAASVGG